jgi:hypothetical protein
MKTEITLTPKQVGILDYFAKLRGMAIPRGKPKPTRIVKTRTKPAAKAKRRAANKAARAARKVSNAGNR